MLHASRGQSGVLFPSASALALVLAVSGCSALEPPAPSYTARRDLNLHSLWTVKGSFRVSPDTVKPDDLPAVFCTGRGGPLEPFSVLGSVLYDEIDDIVTWRVLCHAPLNPIHFPLDEYVYTNATPHNLHVYAWLEPIPGLRAVCGTFDAGLIDATRDLMMLADPRPAHRLCTRPRLAEILAHSVHFTDARDPSLYPEDTHEATHLVLKRRRVR